MKNRPFTILVEGNIGVGKTTLLEHFALYADIVKEPIHLWQNVKGHNLLQLLYDDPQQWAFLFQSYVMLTAVQNHLKVSSKPVKLIERSIFSSQYCFSQLLYQTGKLHEVELDVLMSWSNFLTSSPQLDLEVDLIIYLRTDPQTAFDRIKLRAREEENNISLQFVHKLHNFHDNWLLNHKFPVPAPVLVLDANLDQNEIKQMYLKLQKLLVDKNLV
jgi:deoxyadenosine/deoxycytidine kinase